MRQEYIHYFSILYICNITVIKGILNIQAWYCADRYCSNFVTCAGFVEITSGSESELLDATSTVGPIR